MSMTREETWAVLARTDTERFGAPMPARPWNLTSARLGHCALGALDLSGDDLSNVHLQMSAINGANLARSNLSAAHLQDAWVTAASLAGANMGSSKLGGCKLVNSDLSHVDLQSADLNGTNLRGASLRGANLTQATIAGGVWDGVDVAGATFGYTIMANVNLANVINLDAVRHEAPSTLGMDTILKSVGNIPDAFLLGCGVPPSVITQFHAIFASQAENKVFLSYTYGDYHHNAWVEKLALALNALGIFVFFDKWDVVPGDSITKYMDDGIGGSKCGLFICTRESVKRADTESRWTGYEAIQFKADLVENRKRIVAILRGGVEVPRYLRGRRWIDMRDDSTFNDGVSAIADLVFGRSTRPILGKPVDPS